MDTNEVYAVLDQFKSASEALSSALRVIMGQLRDIQSENEQLNSANARLSDDNNTLRTRQHDLEGELFNARREGRQAITDYESGKAEVIRLGVELASAQEECKKLREVILNVAAATDAIVNPKAPEVAPVKAPEPVQEAWGNPAPTGGNTHY